METAKKLLVIFVKKLDYASAIAVRLTQLTGKSKIPIHPKHFLTQRPWFTDYLSKKDIVLDLGSGNGQNAIKAAKIAKKIVGLEYNQTLINIAVKTAVARRIKNVKFVKTDLEKKIKRSVGVCYYSDPDHKIEYSKKGIISLLKSHKFEIHYFGYGKFDTPLRGIFDIIGSISIPIYKKITKWREKKAKKSPIEASGFEIVAANRE